ncbi:MAG: cytochrome P450 [Sphingomonadales bacterium]|nr:cytochrome P450 [Sphingomonadales bacterium]
MQALAELDLPYLPVQSPEFGADPTGHFARARAQHPWLARSDIGYFVHEYRAIRELFWMDDKMRPSFDGIVEQLGAHGTPWGRFTEEQMISLPPAQHKLLRDTFAARFTPRFANNLRPMMRETITGLLDEWVSKGRFDFEEFASWFPISVMFRLVGAPVARIGAIKKDLETLGLAFSMDKTRVPALQQSITRLDQLVHELIATRRARPAGDDPEDLLDLVISAGDGGGISERQLADLIMFFFIAGYDTSKNVLTFTMHLMMKNPTVYARCAEDHDYCRKAIEEALRYFNPGTTFRFTDQDIVFRDVLLPRDTMLFFPLSISGRDPDAFPDAETFDPERAIDPNTRHLAFGLGKHMCLGQYIARAQLQESLHLIAQRIKDPRLDGEYGWRPFPGTWGLKGLPIRFAAG